MIIATAGHVDHGKTSLVRALTGIDTDRLPEEKARGLTIDLGFAYLPDADGHVVGFVDVPGHERFVRNMLAGVCGIDMALLVVAADDGPMPQTLEHLRILDLLGVSRLLPVITKIDRVDASTARETAERLRDLVRATHFIAEPAHLVSSLTGEGIAGLRDWLRAESRSQVKRRVEGRRFRMAIDRAFSVSGSGLVVTGTVLGGEVQAGAVVAISPGGMQARVRTLQLDGKPLECARAGDRCALNLTGPKVSVDTVERGHWLVDLEANRATSRIDALLTLPWAKPPRTGTWTPVQMHLGAASTSARFLAREGKCDPGNRILVTIVLDRPVNAVHGERFIVRDPSASTTLGGGVILDPFPSDARRNTAERMAIATALAQDCADDAIRELASIETRGIDLGWFESAFNVSPAEANRIYERSGISVLGNVRRIGVSVEREQECDAAIIAALERARSLDPASDGITLHGIRQAIGTHLADDAVEFLARRLARAGLTEIVAERIRLAGHVAGFGVHEEEVWSRIHGELERDTPLPPRARDIAATLGVPEAAVSDLLHRKSARGACVKVTDHRFLLPATIARLARMVEDVAREAPGAEFTAADFRDRCGANRRLSIRVLEYFDRVGYTRRRGDNRFIVQPIEHCVPGLAA
jgi:selenocysteine-specific elongation factor